MIWIIPLIFVLVAGYIFWWNSNENKAIPDTDAVDLFKEAQRILSNSIFKRNSLFSRPTAQFGYPINADHPNGQTPTQTNETPKEVETPSDSAQSGSIDHSSEIEKLPSSSDSEEPVSHEDKSEDQDKGNSSHSDS
ncbi:MAG TPA: hypothetical protein PKJ76_05230 [Flexilinea sp.]|nr:hypothetical protein [Flexilinea sp.]